MVTEPEERPLLRVVRGTPDAAELAALVAVVSGMAAGGGAAEEPRRRPLWSDPRARMRRPITHGPGAWRASGLPG